MGNTPQNIPADFDPLSPAASPAAFGLAVYDHAPYTHHARWLQLALDPVVDKLLIIAPRESAKTQWMAQSLLAWWISTFPLSTNFIGSVGDAQAKERLNAVQMLIEANDTYKAHFPHTAPDKRRGWSERGLHIKRNDMEYGEWAGLVARKGHPKDASLSAAGVGSSTVIGSRISGLCVIDDPHDEKSAISATMREKAWNWLMLTVDPTLTPSAKLIVITTRWHRDDMAGRLKIRPEWVVDETRAIDQDGNSYWPAQWPMERLKKKERDIGKVFFRAAYLNDPTGLAGQVFDLAHFKWYPEALPEFTRVIIGVDLAISKKETADYTAIATIGIDAEKNIYVLDVKRGHWGMGETMKQVKGAAQYAKVNHGRIDLVAIEQVQYQAAVVQQMLSTTTLPVVGVVPDKDKRTRAEPWRLRAEQGKLFVDRDAPWWLMLSDELVDFPSGQHDDMIDAISAGWQGAQNSPLIIV